jgi:hypothetical protein
MSAFVIDENVLIVAEKQAPDKDTNDACIQNCIEALRKVRTEMLVLDSNDLIFAKYRKHFEPIRRNGQGTEFLIWLMQNQFYPDRCERVKITPLEPSFVEVPLELRNPDPATNKIFDLDDHIWLAAAKASVNNPIILNATDTDWYEWRDQLKEHDFQLEFLCPNLMDKPRASIS